MRLASDTGSCLQVSGDTERKTCAVGMTLLLTQAPEMLSTYGEVGQVG